MDTYACNVEVTKKNCSAMGSKILNFLFFSKKKLFYLIFNFQFQIQI
jgi:hypothetical protein